MEAFHTHSGIGVPLRRSNVDTDQIIPAVFLEAGHPNRFRGRLVRGLAVGSCIRAKPQSL